MNKIATYDTDGVQEDWFYFVNGVFSSYSARVEIGDDISYSDDCMSFTLLLKARNVTEPDKLDLYDESLIDEVKKYFRSLEIPLVVNIEKDPTIVSFKRDEEMIKVWEQENADHLEREHLEQ